MTTRFLCAAALLALLGLPSMHAGETIRGMSYDGDTEPSKSGGMMKKMMGTKKTIKSGSESGDGGGGDEVCHHSLDDLEFLEALEQLIEGGVDPSEPGFVEKFDAMVDRVNEQLPGDHPGATGEMVLDIFAQVTGPLAVRVNTDAACITALIGFIANLFGLFLSIFGLAGATPIATEIAEAYVSVEGAVEDAIEIVQSQVSEATKIANLILGVFRKVSVSTILSIIAKNTPWYKWLILGVSLSAQFAAFILTDGLSVAFQIIGLLAATGGFAVAAAGVIQNC